MYMETSTKTATRRWLLVGKRTAARFSWGVNTCWQLGWFEIERRRYLPQEFHGVVVNDGRDDQWTLAITRRWHLYPNR